MKKINPLYFRFNKGWPLHNFLKFGVIIGIVFGIIMTFCFLFFKYLPSIFVMISAFPFTIAAYFVNELFSGDAVIGFWFIILLFLIAVSVLYHALLGMFAGFLANALFCLYKKVKVKINEEDNNIDYIGFSKKITKKEIMVFFIFGMMLACLVVVASSYFLLNWDFVELGYNDL